HVDEIESKRGLRKLRSVLAEGCERGGRGGEETMFHDAYARWQYQVSKLVDKADDMLKELEGMRHTRALMARATAGGFGDPAENGPGLSRESFLLQVREVEVERQHREEMESAVRLV
ncbi:MAG: hypothetical protein Q9207_007398, partial [Kuettlingeria erythrocarpa]